MLWSWVCACKNEIGPMVLMKLISIRSSLLHFTVQWGWVSSSIILQGWYAGFREEDLNISSSSSRRCSSRNSYDCSSDIVVLLPLKAVRACSIWQPRDDLSTVVAVTIAAEEIKICDAGSRSMDCSCETFLRLVFFLLLWLWVFFLMDFFF